MNKIQINTFTRKITSGNGSEIISTMYEIFFVYAGDACKALKASEGNRSQATDEEIRKNLRQAGLVLEHLKGALDFKYQIAGNLFSLYDYAERKCAESIYRNTSEGVEEAMRIMKPLQEAFIEVAAGDHSAPLMRNTQSIGAGYTYGRYDVNEVTLNYDSSRGFFA